MKLFGDRSQRLPLLLAGVVALLVLNTVISATRYLAIENRLRLPVEDSPVWASAQLEVELARFLIALDDFHHGEQKVSPQSVAERFDIAWSRLALFSAGVHARWLSDKPEARAALDRLQRDLERVDPLVAGLEPTDHHHGSEIRNAILPHLPIIKRITAASVQDELDDRAVLSRAQNTLRTEIKVFSASAFASFFALMIYLVRAEARSRAAVRELSATRAEAEAAGNRLSEAIANINEGFVLYDAEDRLVICNAKYREYYALSAEAIEPGRTFEEILRLGVARGQYVEAVDDPDEFLRKRMQRRDSLGDPFEQLLGDGRWLMISDRRTSEGGLVGIRTDISELKRREAELEETKAILQQQAEELRLLALREQKANAAKSEFLATLSHEIRTPMNAVVGLSELLAGTRLDPEAARYVAAVNEAANQLLHLINTILDLSRLEAGRAELDLAPFDLGDTLGRLTSVAGALAASKPVAVACVTDPALPRHVMGDEGRLYQVLLNLLANSVKFTAEGTVTLRARPAGDTGHPDRVRFDIVDTGPGLPAAVVERLFEPFVRGEDAQDPRQAGTGLGLAISRRFVDLLGGRIGVADTSARGTTFFVELDLPRATVALPAAPLPAEPLASAAPLRLLVAEDTASSRLVVEAMLRKLGHDVVCVDNGREAVEAVRRGRFDAVLMDMQMPVLDGVEATRLIRLLPGAAGTTPVIFLTAQALPEARSLAAEAGTPFYLTKPVRLAELRGILAEAREGSSADAGGASSPTARQATADPVVFLLDAMKPAIAELRDAFDPETFVAVLDRFRQDAVERVAALGAAFRRGDVAVMRKEAHKIAGVLGQLGMVELAAEARAVSHADADETTVAGVPALLQSCAVGLEALSRLAVDVGAEA